MISIVVTDHKLYREGLRALTEINGDRFRITGEASCGMEALRKLEEVRPDILLTDIELPDINGIELTRKASTNFPETRVIIYSSRTDEFCVLSALRNGAMGYILKSESFDQLSSALNKVYAGSYYLSDEVLGSVVRYYCESNHEGSRFDSLTGREKEVLMLVKDGLTNTGIARKLQISRRTVEAHRFRGMKKLRLRNQVELVRYFTGNQGPESSEDAEPGIELQPAFALTGHG